MGATRLHMRDLRELYQVSTAEPGNSKMMFHSRSLEALELSNSSGVLPVSLERIDCKCSFQQKDCQLPLLLAHPSNMALFGSCSGLYLDY